MSQYTMIQCPTCLGLGHVPESTDEHERERAIQNALLAMESAANGRSLHWERGLKLGKANKNLRRDNGH